MYKERLKIYAHETLEYDRKSRSDDPLLSVEEVLAKHARILDDYANEFLGGPIPEENKYKEVGSSESINTRPEMLRLLKAVESPKVKAVLVVDVQRLSRGDLEDAGRLIRILRYTNTIVITPMRYYDLRDDYDRDAFERELKKGNEYLEYFKKIQARGKLRSVKDGNYVGSVAPYGFDRIAVKDGKETYYTLIERKDQADVVRLIFNWYCNEDIGAKAICRRLEQMKIKTKNGSDKWNSAMIFTILENVHYIGCVRWNWRKTIKIIEDQEIKPLRPKAKDGEYLVFEGKHEGIISKELFEKAKEIKGNRHRTKTDTELQNPLSGIMYCAKCGSKIGYNTYMKHGVETAPPKLVCNNQVRCKTGSAKFQDVMDRIRQSLEYSIKDFEVAINNDISDEIKLHKELLDTLGAKMTELELKELNQWEALHDPDPMKRMPVHIFDKLNKKLLDEKEELRIAIKNATEMSPRPVDYKEKIMKFTDAIKIIDDPNVSAKIKNQYLRDIIARIEYDRPPNVRITKENAAKYNTTTSKGMKFHQEPFTLKIKLR